VVDHQLETSSQQHYFDAARRGHLPKVSWVMPPRTGEHPPDDIGNGQAWVTVVSAARTRLAAHGDHRHVGRLGQVLRSRATAQGGANGCRMRAALMICPWARRGYIDHRTLSFDAYLKFIEDRFLGGSGSSTDGWLARLAHGP
jgi:phospholipase C